MVDFYVVIFSSEIRALTKENIRLSLLWCRVMGHMVVPYLHTQSHNNAWTVLVGSAESALLTHLLL